MTRHHLHHHIQKEFAGFHAFDYLLLTTIALLALVGVQLFSGERMLEFIVLFGFVSFYIAWGIYHHTFAKNLSLRIALEYILIGFTLLYAVRYLLFP